MSTQHSNTAMLVSLLEESLRGLQTSTDQRSAQKKNLWDKLFTVPSRDHASSAITDLSTKELVRGLTSMQQGWDVGHDIYLAFDQVLGHTRLSETLTSDAP